MNEPNEMDELMQMQKLLPSRALAMNDEYGTSGDLDSDMPYVMLQTRQMCQLSMDERANIISNHLKSNSKLIEDDLKSYMLRIETLKTMPQSVAIRRMVKSKLEATIAQRPKSKTVSYWNWLKYKNSYNFAKIYSIICDISPSLELWYRVIRSIEGQYGSGIAAYFKFLRWLIYLNILPFILSVLFIVVPQSLTQTHSSANITPWDFFTGSGFFRNSIMYYGFYTNSSVNLVFNTTYNIPSAYCLTLLCCYTVTFIILCIKVASSYRMCYIETRGNIQGIYCNRIFCGWDCSISSLKAANIHTASLYRELRELLAETEHQSDTTSFEKFVAIVVKIIASIVVFLIIFATAILLWALLDKQKLGTESLISVMIVPMVVTVIMHMFPAIISWIAHLENYSNKRTKLYVTVIRIQVMTVTVIGIHFTFWLFNSTIECWETKLGEEIYRLLLLDAIVAVFGVYMFEVIHFALYRMGWKWIRKLEFDIACGTLNLIYNQILFWLGLYFCPVMPVIILLKMISIFYVRKHSLLTYYGAPSRVWRAAQTETLFLALAFLCMITVSIALGYVVTNIESKNCGPFQEYDNAWYFAMHNIFSVEKDSVAAGFMLLFTSPATGAAILISMCGGVYCLRAKVEASKEMLQVLKKVLVLQSRDKEFLLKSFSIFDRKCRTQVHNQIYFVSKGSSSSCQTSDTFTDES